MNTWILAEYNRLRKLNWPANEALRAAKITDEFQDLEAQGLIKFEIIPDEFSEFDELASDLSQKDRKELEKKISVEGIWEIYASFRLSKKEDWENINGIIGFVGGAWKDSGYDIDLKSSAIKALKEKQEILLNEEVQELSKRATYAGA